MKKELIILLILFSAFVTNLQAVPLEWSVGNDHNHHYYAVINIGAGIDWNSAKTEAEGLTLLGLNGWHLATITSSSESAFITTLVAALDLDEQIFVGGFLNGSWQWVTSEPWSYTNWHATEPSGTGEDALALKGKTWGYQWNDTPKENTLYWYVAEVPEPATLLLLGLGGLMMRKRS